MTKWPNIDDNLLKRILWQFTTQRSDYLLPEFRKHDFCTIHPEAQMFYEAVDFALQHITSVNLSSSRPWDSNNDFLVQSTKDWINYCLKNKLCALTGDIDIDFIISLSAEKQESRTVKNASICIIPYQHFISLDSTSILVSFEEINRKKVSIPYTHAVRKQLDLSTGGSLAITKAPGSDAYQTFGIVKSEISEKYPCFIFQDYLIWSFMMPNSSKIQTCKLRFNQGSFMMPSIDLEKALNQHIKNQIGNYLSNDTDTIEIISNLVSATASCEHGAILIFADHETIVTEARRLSENYRGIYQKNPTKLVTAENDAILDNLLRLSSIDGAILSDFQGNCFAFGVILYGIVKIPGNSDRGSRLNSTKTYIESKILNKDGKYDSSSPRYVGVVRSEDGMADIFPENEVRVKSSVSLN